MLGEIWNVQKKRKYKFCKLEFRVFLSAHGSIYIVGTYSILFTIGFSMNCVFILLERLRTAQVLCEF